VNDVPLPSAIVPRSPTRISWAKPKAVWGVTPASVRTWGWDEDWQAAHFCENFDLSGKRIIQQAWTDIGCLAVHDEEDHIFLSYIALTPAFQGIGIGSRLIEEVLLQARSKEIPVTLKVLKSNPAKTLYERLGFTVTETTSTHYFMMVDPIYGSA
jgi:ribosomal protein S18 acetylase RimI-like enzyme